MKSIAFISLLVSGILIASDQNLEEVLNTQTKKQPVYYDFAMGALIGLAHGFINRLLEYFKDNNTLSTSAYCFTWLASQALSKYLHDEGYLSSFNYTTNHFWGHSTGQFFAESLGFQQSFLRPRMNITLILSILYYLLITLPQDKYVKQLQKEASKDPSFS
jgi:hypothetical protein